MTNHTVYVGLGSNLANPTQQILQACEALHHLPDTQFLARSPLYQSRAVGPPQPDYINAVAKIATGLPPLVLLDALQDIEQAQGRVRLEHWGPRTLDLDILLIDDLNIHETRLQVPHPYLTQRNFVLVPLHDLEPALALPNGQTLAELMRICGGDPLIQLPD